MSWLARFGWARCGLVLRGLVLCGLVLASSVAGPSSGASETAPSDEVIATWDGGQLTRSTNLDWRAAKGFDDEEIDDPAAIRELVFVLSMAAEHEAQLDERGARRVELDIERHRHRLLLPALERHVTDHLPPIEPAEIEALRRAHPEAFRQPRKLRLRNLYKSFGADEAATREAMAAIHRQLEAGADFEALARAESESQTAVRGGELGLVDPTSLPPSLAEAVAPLEAGEVTPPLEHGGGLTIFRCESVRPAQEPTPDEVREKLRHNLRRERLKEALAETREALFDSVTIDREAACSSAAADERSGATPVLRAPGVVLDRDDVELVVHLQGEADRASSCAVRQQVLESWALGVAAAHRARELGLHRDPELAGALRFLRTEVLARHELRRRIDERLAITEEAARQSFEAHTKRYSRMVHYELAGIQFDDESPEALELAQTVTAQLAKGSLRFEEAARRHSRHPSASDGGYLGWRAPPGLTAWGTVASKTIRTLAPGESTDLLRLEEGLWLFRVLDIEEARPATFDEAREQVEADWRRDRIRELEQTVREEQLEAIDWRLVAPSSR